MICGTATVPIYYTFTCEDSFFWAKTWLMVLQFFCGMALLVTMSQSKSKGTCLFAVAYIAAALSSMPCALHGAYWMQEGQALGFKLWPWIAGELCYAVGATLFGTKTPERFAKGKFDYLGSGHNLFHFSCVVGAVIHIWASFKCFHERQIYSCPETGIYNWYIKTKNNFSGLPV